MLNAETIWELLCGSVGCPGGPKGASWRGQVRTLFAIVGFTLASREAQEEQQQRFMDIEVAFPKRDREAQRGVLTTLGMCVLTNKVVRMDGSNRNDG